MYYVNLCIVRCGRDAWHMIRSVCTNSERLTMTWWPRDWKQSTTFGTVEFRRGKFSSEIVGNSAFLSFERPVNACTRVRIHVSRIRSRYRCTLLTCQTIIRGESLSYFFFFCTQFIIIIFYQYLRVLADTNPCGYYIICVWNVSGASFRDIDSSRSYNYRKYLFYY